MSKPRQKRAQVKAKLRPTNRMKAAMAMSYMFNHCTEQQLKRLMKKTLQDWTDWLA